MATMDNKIYAWMDETTSSGDGNRTSITVYWRTNGASSNLTVYIDPALSDAQNSQAIKTAIANHASAETGRVLSAVNVSFPASWT